VCERLSDASARTFIHVRFAIFPHAFDDAAGEFGGCVLRDSCSVSFLYIAATVTIRRVVGIGVVGEGVDSKVNVVCTIVDAEGYFESAFG
jgi:hypothetical protein